MAKTYLLEGDVEEKRKESSYSLTAIILLEGAHYRALLELPDGEWSLFNSMHGFDNGHCIPTITYVPGFRQYLESGCRAEYLCSKSDAGRTYYHRLVTECSYAYFFSKSVQSGEAFCRSDCDAGALPTRVLLPDIDDSLIEDLEIVHHVPPSFGHTQPHCMPSLITSPEHFYEACKHVISSKSFPEKTTVKTSFDRRYFCMFCQNLFSSIVFPEFSVNYRIISFSMENGTIVSYHGNIDNLSKGTEKQFFYEQLEREISRQNVISVDIAKIH